MDFFTKKIFKKKRKKKDQFSSICTISDSLLEEMDTCWRDLMVSGSNDDKDEVVNDSSEKITIVRMEIRLLRTFLMICGANCCDDADKRVDQLWNLAMDLKYAFKKARRDIRVASSEKGHVKIAEHLYPAISKLHVKLTHLTTGIEKAYNYVSGYSFQSDHSMIDYDLWVDLAVSLNDDLLQLGRQGYELLEPIMPQIFAISDMVGRIMPFFYHVKEEPGFTDVLPHFGAALVHGAHISYLCWVHRMNENKIQELNIKLFDVLKLFKPDTSRVLELCLKFLRLSNSTSDQVEILIDFLIPQKHMPSILRKGFKNLISFVIHEPNLHEDDDVKLLLMDMTAAASELESFSHPEGTPANTAMGAGPVLVKALEKTMLLNAEQFLLELLYGRIPGKSFVNDRICSFHDGLSFLQNFQGNCQILKPVWIHIGPVAGDAASVYLSFLDGSISEENATYELLKLFEKIKLFKIEILLQDILYDHTNMIINVKKQIDTLYAGLTFLRTFLMGPLEENGKLILEHVESVVREVLECCSCNAHKDTRYKERSMMSLLPKLIERIEQVNAEIKKIYICIRTSLRSNFPKTNAFGFIDFLLENLREMVSCESVSDACVKHQIQVIHIELKSMRSLFLGIEEHCDKQLELKSLISRILEVAYEVEYLVDSFALRGGVAWYHELWLSDVIEDIELIKIEASVISETMHGIPIGNVPQSSKKVISPTRDPQFDEIVVDLDDQNRLMIDRLTRGAKQLDVVAIVGMPGLGKTTLARRVFSHPSVTYHFHVRAWCFVSQVYQKRKLLLEILNNVMDVTDNILEMNEEDLDLQLYQSLKRRRYLIVMDDVWSIEAWNDLERSFPNDENGSRILITSRLPDVVSQTKAHSTPHTLRLLSEHESWELLWKKLFHTVECPEELLGVGKQIAKNCSGLPLAVVAISGLLERTEMRPDSWKQVAEALCTLIAKDPQTMCRSILELSYNHLPDYLKPCFLYLGVFFQDEEISVRKLAWLWVAEGFIPNTKQCSVEDLAEVYLKDLIGRSIVIASRKRSDGRVKTCRVHDLLLSLCLMRCEEERFLECITGYDELCSTSYDDSDYGVDPSYSYPTSNTPYKMRRLSICSKRNHFVMARPSGPHVRSLLFSARSDLYPRCPYDISFISDNFKLLRVLDLERINMGYSFPTGIDLMVHLRFLALSGDIDYIPISIANLHNLETLLVKGLKGRVRVPDTVWSMAKLRHVHINNIVAFSFRMIASSPQLENLMSLSSPCLACGKDTENIMRRLPRLRKLKCLFLESRDNVRNHHEFPVLEFLTELESLNVVYSGRIAFASKFNFPTRLKKLTLSKFRLPWDCISEIGRLPYLEVLKLLSRSFEGRIWDMKEGEFTKLKFLKLDTLNIAQWNACSDNLPNLQCLVLRSCRQLEEVPSGFGDIDTLETIEVQLCRRSAEESVRRLKEEQSQMGYAGLKVLINRSDLDL